MTTITIRARSIVWFVTGAVTALVAGAVVMNTLRADAAPGDDDATFVPITPCRLVDTREPAHDIWGPDVTQSLPAHGVNGECVIPTDAVGLSMNVTAVGPTEPTFLTVWPDDQPRPKASSLNPTPGEPPTPNAVTTELAPNGRFRVYNLQGHVDVIVDLNGYFTSSSLHEIHQRLSALESSHRHAAIDADSAGASIVRGAGVQSVSRLVAGVYQVDFEEPINTCTWHATLTANDSLQSLPGEISVERTSPSDVDSLWVRTYDSSGNETDPADDVGFSLHVVC